MQRRFYFSWLQIDKTLEKADNSSKILCFLSIIEKLCDFSHKATALHTLMYAEH